MRTPTIGTPYLVSRLDSDSTRRRGIELIFDELCLDLTTRFANNSLWLHEDRGQIQIDSY